MILNLASQKNKEIQETLPDIASRRNWKLGDWS
jgi:hypothetical protein